MMASSQVEFVTPSPFGCRPGLQYNNTNNYQQKKKKNQQQQIDISNTTDLWVHPPHPNIKNTVNNIQNQPIISVDHHDISNAPKHSIDETPTLQKHKANNTKWSRARDIVFLGRNEISPLDIPNPGGGGVSSLVQIWKSFEAVAKSPSSSKTPTTIAAPLVETAESISPPSHADVIFTDWEYDDKTPSRGGRASDATESEERVRVSDIIKKLIDLNEVNGSPHNDSPIFPIRTSSSSSDHRQQSEQQQQIPAICKSPRIRGRQAFNDLFMQMERDRQNELERLVACRAVSNFSHRGRIQALVRFKFLRRATEEADVTRHSSSGPSHGLKQITSVHFRKKIKSSLPSGSLSSNYELTGNTAVQAEARANQHKKVTCLKISTETTTTSIERNVVHQTHRLTNFVDPTNSVVGFTVTETSKFSLNNAPHNAKDEEPVSHLVMESNKERENDYTHPICNDQEEIQKNKYLVETSPDWVTEACHAIGDEWEELECYDDEKQEGIGNDWIDEVSRPRSDWEGLRKARYQEMLDPFQENEDIRKLLGRKSVSNFLSSGLRNQIDKVMLSRTQGQKVTLNKQIKDEVHEHVDEKGVPIDNMVALEEHEDEEGDNFSGYYDGYEKGSMEHKHSESDECSSTIISPLSSWSQNEASNHSSEVSSPSPRACRSLPSTFYTNENASDSSFTAHPKIEIELVHDLKRHMEQLHQEMYELRKSIKCCLNMQGKLQDSVKQEVAITNSLNHHLDGGVDKKGGKCCICCKLRQVDSVLYRCGHMCTCYKCGHELQGSNGQCPICRAPIMDIVRISHNYDESTST